MICYTVFAYTYNKYKTLIDVTFTGVLNSLDKCYMVYYVLPATLKRFILIGPSN